MIVERGDFEDPKVVELLRLHLVGMHANSPPGHVQALDLSGLRQPAISFYVVRWGAEVAGMGALKELDTTCGELKSMRVAPEFLRRGVGELMLLHLIGVARERGYRRLSLETGSGPAFEPALALYRKHGFAEGAAFGDYTASAFNTFFHLNL